MKKTIYIAIMTTFLSILTINHAFADGHNKNLSASEAIAAVNAQLEQGFANGDAQLITDIYSNGAQLLPPNSPVISGEKAILEFWQGAIGAGIKQAELETVELEIQQNMAVEVGTYVLKGDEGALVDVGKYMIIWKKENNHWKYHRDIWNSDKPAS